MSTRPTHQRRTKAGLADSPLSHDQLPLPSVSRKEIAVDAPAATRYVEAHAGAHADEVLAILGLRCACTGVPPCWVCEEGSPLADLPADLPVEFVEPCS